MRLAIKAIEITAFPEDSEIDANLTKCELPLPEFYFSRQVAKSAFRGRISGGRRGIRN
jgi:hypothetical protein